MFSNMIQVRDRYFIPFIAEKELQKRVAELGAEISVDYRGKTPILIGVMNGAFMFLADLSRNIDLPLEVSFIRIASYDALASTGSIRELAGLEKDLAGRDVIIVEDIVDSGLSISHVLDQIREKKPSSIEVCSLLLKPEALKMPVSAKYLGFEIPDKFVVGYGLDYDGEGRNLKEIYQLK